MLRETAAAILGVHIDATFDQMRTAYRRRARLYHPDRLASASAREREVAGDAMAQLNIAMSLMAGSRQPDAPPEANTSMPGAAAKAGRTTERPQAQQPQPAAQQRQRPQAQPPTAPQPKAFRHPVIPLSKSIQSDMGATESLPASGHSAKPMTWLLGAVLMLAGILGLAAQMQGRANETLTESEAIDPQLTQEPVISAPDLPVGFYDMGDGFAFRWIDEAECSTNPYIYCVTAELYAYEDCPTAVHLEANILDSSNLILDRVSTNVSSLQIGDHARAVLTWFDEQGQQADIMEVWCDNGLN